MTFLDVASARALFDGMELESFDEEESEDEAGATRSNTGTSSMRSHDACDEVVLQRVLRASVTVDGERSLADRTRIPPPGRVGRRDPSDEPERWRRRS